MEITIRPVKMSDAPALYEMRIMPGVFENITATPFERIEESEKFVRDAEHSLSAEVEGQVAGNVVLKIHHEPRSRHCASIGIIVHRDFQGKGVGRALMNALIDAADNWLTLKRLELYVFTDNEKAINLYKSFGFVIEGTLKYFAVKNGKYCDMYVMARYHDVH